MLNDKTVTYFVDIDGVVVDARKRFAYAGPEPDRDVNPGAYNAWLKRVQSERSLAQDEPIRDMVQKVQLLRDGGATVAFLTAREAVWREVTQNKLNEIGLHDIPLLMRPPGNVLKSGTYKTAVLGLQRMKHCTTPVVMIDDDPDGHLTPGCQALGITLYRASFSSEGKFQLVKVEAA